MTSAKATCSATRINVTVIARSTTATDAQRDAQQRSREQRDGNHQHHSDKHGALECSRGHAGANRALGYHC